MDQFVAYRTRLTKHLDDRYAVVLSDNIQINPCGTADIRDLLSNCDFFYKLTEEILNGRKLHINYYDKRFFQTVAEFLDFIKESINDDDNQTAMGTSCSV